MSDFLPKSECVDRGWGMQGSSLFYRLSAAHGYLNKQGYCTGSNTLGRPSGTCHKFPVIIGETGTNFQVALEPQ